MECAEAKRSYLTRKHFKMVQISSVSFFIFRAEDPLV